jgi:hypothetical protein
MTEYLLPEILKSGMVLDCGSHLVTLKGTSKRDDFNMRLFRLTHHKHEAKDATGRVWYMPQCTGSTLYSRDELQGLGAKVVAE